MRKISKIALGSFVFLMIFSMFSMTSVLAAVPDEVPVESEYQPQYHIEANNQVMFRFMQQTRLTFATDVDLDVIIDCDASEIGVKYFEMEVHGSGPLLMNMTCTEEQVQLGLQKGYTIRNRYRYEEGFCIQIKCNGTCDAQLKIQANNRNRFGTWAYYDGEKWVTSATTIEDGFLVTETSHFSYWTVLIPQADLTVFIYVGAGVFIGVMALVSVYYIKKRK